MPPAQAAAYRDLIVRAAAETTAGSGGRGAMLSTLAALRGTSLHPVDPRQSVNDLDAYARDSARLMRTLEVLDEIARKREKALVFVEDLAMQERLASIIQTRYGLPEPPIRINGAVPGAKRQALVDRFQRDRTRFDVMILSPKAGGVGLTLTAANHVIHLSRWWNPAVEDQATDRVFRIGQERDVHVHLPLAVHPDPAIRESSFDLRLNALIDRKRALTRDLFFPPEGDDADLNQLFREVAVGETDPTSSEQPPTAEASLDSTSTTSEAPKPDTKRPTLGLAKLVVQSGVRVWRVDPGQPRPTDEILAIFAGRELTHVHIRDPYALAHPNSRAAQIAFLKDLAAKAKAIEAVTVDYVADLPTSREPDSAQRRDFGAAFSSAFRDQKPRMALNRRTKSRDDDFHDRFVDLEVRHAGGITRSHALMLGRGLEALYDKQKQCTVSYVPPADGPG